MSEGGGAIKVNVPGAGTILGIIGMLGSIFGAYTALDRRVSQTEQSSAFAAQRLDRIEEKLDRLIEKQGEEK